METDGWDIQQVAGWLQCKTHGEPYFTWCDHIHDYVESGDDAETLHTGMHVNVPIFPTAGVWALVEVDSEKYGESALMMLKHTPDIGREIKVPLGFWNPGEGRRVIRSVILDHIRSKIDPEEDLRKPTIKTKCPNGAHGLAASQVMARNADLTWKWKCLWNIVMEKACTPCVEESSGVSDNNFGIDDSVVAGGKPAWKA